MTTPAHPSCAEVLRLVSAYLDEELDADVCQAIEAHCAVCANCAHVVATLKDTIGLCRATGQRPLPAAVRDRARASIRALLAGANEKPG